MEEKKKEVSFWTTLPGTLMGFAALVTAIGGFIGILYKVGIIPCLTPEPYKALAPTTPVAATLPPTNTPSPIEISQTKGQTSAWLGDSPGYVGVGQGQSFVVKKTAILKEIEIYLKSNVGNARSDQIICDLRNADMVVLGSSSIEGFSSGGGWKAFAFNAKLDPGTYIFTCYLHNSYHLEQHHYGIHGNANDNSYLEGTRYVSTGGHPEDESTWKSSSWDLKFTIRMEAVD